MVFSYTGWPDLVESLVANKLTTRPLVGI